jgi:glycosyltransferase involved in cell wall biosynthesis
MPDLSIILNIKNRANLFRFTSDSMIFHSGKFIQDHDVELVVVDEKSDDGLIEILRELSSYIKVRRVQLNTHAVYPDLPCYNPVVGLNAGILNARSEKLLFIQPETLFMKDNVGFAYSGIVDNTVWLAETYNGSPQMLPVFNREWLLSAHYHVLHYDSWGSWTNRIGMGSPYPYMVATTVKAMREIGLLDVNYMGGWAGDDDDWLLRHKRVGHMVEITDGMACYHVNHNIHNEKGFVVNLDGSELHKRNIAILDIAREQLTAENVQDTFAHNYETTQQCIELVECI